MSVFVLEITFYKRENLELYLNANTFIVENQSKLPETDRTARTTFKIGNPVMTRPRKIGDVFLFHFVPNLLPQIVFRRSAVFLPIGGRRFSADEERERSFRRNGIQSLGDVGGEKTAETNAGNRQKNIAWLEKWEESGIRYQLRI